MAEEKEVKKKYQLEVRVKDTTINFEVEAVSPRIAIELVKQHVGKPVVVSED